MTQVVVLPALRDVHHVPVFPQPKFAAAILDKEVRKHLHLLPNPASFEAGGYTFGCSSLDTMMLLTQQELRPHPNPNLKPKPNSIPNPNSITNPNPIPIPIPNPDPLPQASSHRGRTQTLTSSPTRWVSGWAP